jgi:hypothetical protein
MTISEVHSFGNWFNPFDLAKSPKKTGATGGITYEFISNVLRGNGLILPAIIS